MASRARVRAGQLAALLLGSSRSRGSGQGRAKFGNQRVVVDSKGQFWSTQQAKRLQIAGVTCDSVGEAKHFVELRERERRGEIQHLRHPHPFTLTVRGVIIGELRVDFSFIEHGRLVAHDYKGRHDKSRDTEYRFFRWKCKHLKAEHGIDVVEIHEADTSARAQWTRRLRDVEQAP